uniref:Acyl-CoA synthetase (AMP-forming)/AMP-acid ligase II n=1 Tax=Candidatus Kentrum sp. FW TaxID=2126338 RepID=A0A450SGD6_9GAMM|nr:MAG: Acyl-CoA synthetase (AMP-forming)/AMP-acid ligase II [Candidatus Kentron sp. FW]
MNRQEVHIAGTGTAFPYPVPTAYYQEMDAKIRRLHGVPEFVIETLRLLFEGSGIRFTHTVCPHWLPENKSPSDYPDIQDVVLQEDIFTPYNYIPPFWKRMSVFKELLRKLGTKAARNAIADWGGDPQDITHIFTTCTGGWTEPGLPGMLIKELGLRYDCQKAELNFNGCFCGATCLRLGRDAIRAGDGKAVLIVALEVASLHYDPRLTDMDDLVPHVIFKDGAAAVILAREGPWRYKKTGMSIVPDTADRMTFEPPVRPESSTYRMHLDKDVGAELDIYFREGSGAEILGKVYEDTSKPPPKLGIHPGGIRILEGMKRPLVEHGWPEDGLDASFETLFSYGNLGSAAMLAVMDRLLKAHKEERTDATEEKRELVTMAFGPGVTAEWALLEEVAYRRDRKVVTTHNADARIPAGHVYDNHRSTPATTLVELLRYRAQTQPDKITYTFLKDGEVEEASLTYGQLDLQARAIAARLQEIATPGDRALLLYPSGLEFISAFFGCLYAGVVAVPTYPPRRNRPDPRFRAIAGDAGANVVLTTASILPDPDARSLKTPALRNSHWLATDGSDTGAASSWQTPNIQSDTLAFLQYTSGSTGTPRGVMVSHGNLLYNEEMFRLAFEDTEDSIGVGWLPLFHDMGLIGNVLQPLYLGTPITLMSPMAFLQKPLCWLRAISRYRATTSGGPNFAYDLCVEKTTPEQRAGLDLGSWTLAFNGAEPIRPETLERFTEAFAPYGFRREAFYPCYGMAETVLFVSGGSRDAPPVVHEASFEKNRGVGMPGATRKFVGCGRTWLEQEIIVVDQGSLVPCSDGQTGEIWVQGKNVAQGYWNRPEETKETFHVHLTDSGEGPFLRTGDLGFLKDGELFVTGRLKDLIII